MSAPDPQLRWCRLTPERLVLLLLAVEGLLWLSERFQWFPFNHHRGWTVLIAVATVGVALLLLPLWFAVALVRRQRFQFSIRLLLALVAAVALPCGWLAVEVKRAGRQREAVEGIQTLKGVVQYDYQLEGTLPPRPDWLRKLLGDNFFTDVVGTTPDVGLQYLERLPQLKVLNLGGVQVTDAGLKHLEGLTKLQWLTLEDTQVTDAGLEHLRGLTQLKALTLTDTQVTDEGVKTLQEALPNCTIYR